MRLLIVIPARIGSSRLPEKPLQLLAGEPLVCHTVRQAISFELDAEIVVATDDERVQEAVAPLGVRAVLTDSAHRSGTERTAAVARHPRYARVQVVVNFQGDEPFMPAGAVTCVLDRVGHPEPIVTAAGPLADSSFGDSNRVKVSIDGSRRARSFSRDGATLRADVGAAEILQHVGVYAYTRAALLEWVELPPVPEERQQRLEQLRPLAYGMPIGVAGLDALPPHGIDTHEDLQGAEARQLAFSHGCCP